MGVEASQLSGRFQAVQATQTVLVGAEKYLERGSDTDKLLRQEGLVGRLECHHVPDPAARHAAHVWLGQVRNERYRQQLA